MLCLEGAFLIEKYMKVGAMGRQWQVRKSLKSPEMTRVQFPFFLRGWLPLSQGAGSAAAAFCSASAEPGSVPAPTRLTSQLAWKVTAHKYKAASPGRRFPRGAVVALHIKSSCAGRR